MKSLFATVTEPDTHISRRAIKENITKTYLYYFDPLNPTFIW